MQHRKIAILGSAPSIAETPQEGWEYWSLMSNYDYDQLPIEPDRWFELHNVAHLQNLGVTEGALKVAGELDNLWMFDPIGKAELFPRKEVLKLGSYFTSSIAWLMGLAILEQPQTIGLYGVDLILNKEYERERPCIEYWIGRAQDRGINVEISKISTLIKGPLYPDPFAYELQIRAKDDLAKLEKAEKDAQYYKGRCDLLRELRFTKG